MNINFTLKQRKVTSLKQLVLLVCLFLSINASAFTVDGIEYAISSDTECEVKSGPRSGDLVIPSDVTDPSTGKAYKVTSIGRVAFTLCRGLTSLRLPSGLTSIGDFAFDGCTGLISLTLPSSLTSIGYCAFRACHSLTSLTIPSGIISIGKAAFVSCRGLTSLTLPLGLTSIGEYAFLGCTNLSSMYSYNPIPPTAELTVFDEVPTSCILYVPKGSKPKYSSDSVWGVFDIREFDADGINDAINDAADMTITQSANGALMIKSTKAMVIPIYTEGGAMVRKVQLQSGENTISGLQKGLYIVNGNKVIIR